MASTLRDFAEANAPVEVDITRGLKVKVRPRPNLMSMAANGQIPNPLLPLAAQLLGLARPTAPKDETEKLKQEIKYNKDVIELYVLATLLEPAYDEVKDLLTDEDKLIIATYAKKGVQQAGNF